MIIKAWKKLNPVLRGLILGILFFGVLFQVTLMWMAERKLFFTTGLWIGVGLALFMICHMYYSLDNGLEFTEKGAADKYMYRMYAIRAGIVLVIFFTTFYFKLGNMLSVFLGMITLKLSGYLLTLIQNLKK